MQAQVVLMRPDGTSVLDCVEPLTAENIERFKVDDEAIATVARSLEELGFELGSTGPFGLSIQADASLFERVFGLQASSREARGDQIPASLRKWVVSVTPSEPPEMFR